MTVPPGYHTITPYFTVEDADKFIRFMTNVFAGSVIKESRYPDGNVQHVRIRVGDSVIMINEQTESYLANVSQMHIYVDNVEQIYQIALKAGASSIMEPNLRPHGDLMAGIQDPCGNVWWLAQLGAT